MPFVKVASGRLGYDEAGTGPAVIFSHASIADRRMWTAQLAAVSSGYRAISYDRLGFGDSDDAAGEVDHATDLLALMDALGLERAALVGSSMGGGVSIDVALAAPQRVSALALVCTGLTGWQWPAEMRAELRPLLTAAVPADRLTAYAEHTADVVLAEDITAMAQMQARFLAVGPERTPDALDPPAWELALAMARRVFEREWNGPAYTEREHGVPPQDRLAEIGVPTLVMIGLADSPYLRAIPELVARGVPDAQRVELADTGHLPPIERPARVTAELLEFLGSAGL
jgi:pimeloyl-ACP methyl ester carboxylesterase